MEQQEPYMPPCCIDRKLPALLRAHGTAFFLSQGDWGLAKLWHAASLLVPSREPVFTLLVMEQVDEASLAIIKQNLAHKWIQAIAIITEQDQTLLVQKHLADYLARVYYCGNRPEAANERGLWLRTNGIDSLTVMGPIHHADGVGHVCQYAARLISSPRPETEGTTPATVPGASAYGPTPPVAHTLMPYRSILRIHSKLKGSDPLFKAYSL